MASDPWTMLLEFPHQSVQSTANQGRIIRHRQMSAETVMQVAVLVLNTSPQAMNHYLIMYSVPTPVHKYKAKITA